ncbi:cilia- and flagella-associated protein 206 [Xenentodon cancila]
MSRPHAESESKHIIDKIVQDCVERGHVVSEELVSFMVKAVMLDPKNGFNTDCKMTKQDVRNLEELCLGKLMEKCSPSLDTIKMQVYFDMNYTSRRALLEEVHRVLESRLTPLSREITDSRVKTRDELDALYHKIVTYILQRSAMGSPADTSTVQEVTAALQSVFAQTELGAFMVLLKKDKEHQLLKLTMIVTGIRLFNKANKNGNEEFNIEELVPAGLKEALPDTNNSIKNKLSVTQKLAWKYTSVLEKLTDPDVRPGKCDVPIVLLKQALCNVRQHEAFLKLLLTDASLCTRHVEILHKDLLSQLKLLRETLQPKAAVPTTVVFPLFKDLSKLWRDLQNEAELLNIYSNIALNLQPFLASQAKVFSEAYLDSLLEAAEVKTDEQRMAESSDEQIDPAEWKTQEWLTPETTAEFNELPLEYDGVCGYILVNRDGLLLPGNPHIGVLRHKEKFYAFSSKEAALKFASCPDDFVAQVAGKAKCFPELIQLLKLHQQFSWVTPSSEVSSLNWKQPCVKPVTKCEISTQTDIHPVERNINKSYEWNEWELRRKALKLADLWTKATHSVQTDLSHMRRENVTQKWLAKDAACQSKRDSWSSVPRPQVYLAGLRGHQDAPVVKTNLTRSVDE